MFSNWFCDPSCSSSPISNGSSSGTSSGSNTITPFYRYLLLVVLCVQTAAGALLINYSNLIKDNNYSNVELVMCCEFVKFLMSCVITCSSVDESGQRKGISWVFKVIMGGKKVIPLVLMYSLANVLAFYTIARIGAPTFTVSYSFNTAYMIRVCLICCRLTTAQLCLLCLQTFYCPVVDTHEHTTASTYITH